MWQSHARTFKKLSTTLQCLKNLHLRSCRQNRLSSSLLSGSTSRCQQKPCLPSCCAMISCSPRLPPWQMCLVCLIFASRSTRGVSDWSDHFPELRHRTYGTFLLSPHHGSKNVKKRAIPQVPMGATTLSCLVAPALTVRTGMPFFPTMAAFSGAFSD